MLTKHLLLAALVFLLISCNRNPYQNVTPLLDLSYKTMNGGQESLSSSKTNGLKGTVFAFLSTQCPEANRYIPRLNEFYQEFRRKKIGFVGVYPMPGERLNEVAAHVLANKIEFPIVKDWEQKLTTHLGATVLSQVVLVNDENKILYSGRIDDQYSVGKMRDSPSSQELLSAMRSLENGDPISVKPVPASGCVISAVPVNEFAGKVLTFNKDIAPIFHKKCVYCHRDGGHAPFSLTKYDEIKKWAASIRSSVLEEYMPPWHVADGAIAYQEKRDLTLTEKDKVLHWLASGLPEGQGKPPALPVFRENLGKPDFTFSAPEEMIKANGKSYFRPTKFTLSETSDTYVRGIVIRPGNHDVVHHVSLMMLLPFQVYTPAELSRQEYAASYSPGMLPWIEFAASYTRGAYPMFYPEGTALVVPPKGQLVLSVHYSPLGVDQKDQTKFDVYLSKTKPVEKLHAAVIASNDFHLLPGVKTQVVESRYKFTKDSKLYMVSPHAHYRAAAFEMVLETKSAKQKVITVPRFDSAYQVLYHLKQPLNVPKDSVLSCRATFDNSEMNLLNPDPSASVNAGITPQDEMMYCFLRFSDGTLTSAGQRR